MTAVQTLAAYALVLVVVFAGGLGLGRLVGPVGTAATPPAHEQVEHEGDR